MNTYARGTVVRVSTSAPFSLHDVGPVDPTRVSLLVTCKGKLKAQYDYPNSPVVRDGVGLYHVDLVTTPGGPPGFGSGVWTYLWAGQGVGFSSGTLTIVEPELVPIWLQNPLPPPVVATRVAHDQTSSTDNATPFRAPFAFATDEADASDVAAVTTQTITGTATDTALVADSATAGVFAHGAATDIAHATDAATRGQLRNVTDTAVAADVATAGHTQQMFATDSALAHDAATSKGSQLFAHDTAVAADVATNVFSVHRLLVDAATASDSATSAGPRSRSLTDTALVADTAHGGRVSSRHATDSATAADTAVRAVRLHPIVHDSATASDVASSGGGGGMAIPPNFQSGTTYTIAPGDAYGAIYMTSTASNTVTLNASVLSVGQWVLVVQYGPGLTQIANGAGMTITSVSMSQTVLFQRGQVMLHVDQANNANLTGDLGA